METGIRVSLNTHAPLTFPGMLSTAGHWDQSRIAIFAPPLIVTGYVMFYYGPVPSSRALLPEELPPPNPHFQGVNPRVRRTQPCIRNMQIAELDAKSIFVVQHMHPQRRRRSKVHRRSPNRHLMIGKQRPTTQLEIRLNPSASREVPLQSQRIKTRAISRVVALEHRKHRHQIHRVLESSLQESRTMRPGQNPSISQ